MRKIESERTTYAVQKKRHSTQNNTATQHQHNNIVRRTGSLDAHDGGALGEDAVSVVDGLGLEQLHARHRHHAQPDRRAITRRKKLVRYFNVGTSAS